MSFIWRLGPKRYSYLCLLSAGNSEKACSMSTHTDQVKGGIFLSGCWPFKNSVEVVLTKLGSRGLERWLVCSECRLLWLQRPKRCVLTPALGSSQPPTTLAPGDSMLLASMGTCTHLYKPTGRHTHNAQFKNGVG